MSLRQRELRTLPSSTFELVPPKVSRCERLLVQRVLILWTLRPEHIGLRAHSLQCLPFIQGKRNKRKGGVPQPFALTFQSVLQILRQQQAKTPLDFRGGMQ